MTAAWLSPDCRSGNCRKCDGTAWDQEKDELTSCDCTHHSGDLVAA